MLGRTTAPSLSPAPTDAPHRPPAHPAPPPPPPPPPPPAPPAPPPADPAPPRRRPRRRRAAACPHHLRRVADRRRDHPGRSRHRRDPGRRAVALLDHLLLVPPARPLGVA